MISLYAALDEPNADVDLILGQLADWYEERGDCLRAECLQWCRREGKRPDTCGWWPENQSPTYASSIPWWHSREYGEALKNDVSDVALVSSCYRRAANSYHALRTRGEEPVAGIDSERMVTT